ncbi:unnamed protein product, partial [Polarella glacialis]
ASEELGVRVARVEAATRTAADQLKANSAAAGQWSSQGGHSTGASSVASLEDTRASRGQEVAHLVGEMEGDLRVELSSRLRSLAAELRGEIMADVSEKVAGAEARASAIEVSLLKELERIAEDLRIGIGNLDKTQLVSRVGVLEEQSRRSSLVLSTLQEERQRQKASSAIEAIEADLRSALSVGKHGVSVATLSERAGDAMSSGSLASAEKGRDSTGSAEVLSDVLQIVNQPPDQSKLFISSGIRERLTGLVSALSWTLGQAGSNPDGSENQDGTESGSGSGGAGGGNST